MTIIQIAGPTHREDGPPLFLLMALNRLGHKCIRMTTLDPVSVWPAFDAVLEVDWGMDCFPDLPPFVPPPDKPSLCVMSDTHWRPEAYAYRLNRARGFKYAFCNQLDAALAFCRDGIPKVDWVPHAAEHTCYTPPMRTYADDIRMKLPPSYDAFSPYLIERHPRFDWCFVGHMNTQRRIDIVSTFCDEFPSYDVTTGLFFEDVSRLYNDSSICLNMSVNGDLNMRSFEVLASRGFLLTDRQQGMEDQGFIDGKTCAIYDSTDEAIEKALYYLDHESERRAVAEAGWRLFLQRHTYIDRAGLIVKALESLLDTSPPSVAQ